MLGHLTVKIGEADVLEVAERFAVAAYRGAQNPPAISLEIELSRFLRSTAE